MATLAGNSIASSYTSLLKLDGNTDSTVAGASGAGIQVKTGDNDATPLYLNTDRVGIGYSSPANPLSVSGVITSGNGTGVGVGGTPSDSNTSEMGAGYINLGRDDTADAKQITFGKNGAVHSYIETTSAGLNIGGANVGIGTGSPISSGVETSLHIYGNHNSNNTILVVEQDGGSSSALINIDSASGRDSYLQFQEAGTTKAGVFNDASADSLVLTDGANSNTVYIKSNSVGIGIEPSEELSIFHATDPEMRFRINTHGTVGVLLGDADGLKIYGQGASQQIRFHAETTEVMRLDTNSRISLSNNDGGATGGTDSTSGNTVFGYLAGSSLDTDTVNNTLYGHKSGTAIDSGDENTAYGNTSLDAATNGSRNTAVGQGALGTHGTLYDCVGIGKGSEVSANGASNQIVIGKDATGVADNSVVLGNASVTDVYMSEDSGAYVHSQNVPNHVANTMSSPYYRFDGVDDLINLGSDANLDNIFDNGGSISGWIYPMSDGEDSGGRIIDKAKTIINLASESGGKTLMRLYIVTDGTDGSWATPVQIENEKWTHFAVVYDNSATANNPTMYLNGVSVTVTEESTPNNTRTSDASDSMIIGNNAGGGVTFDGSIAGIQIRNHELTATEVKELYSGMSVPYKYKFGGEKIIASGDRVPSGSVGNWVFNGTAGGSVAWDGTLSAIKVTSGGSGTARGHLSTTYMTGVKEGQILEFTAEVYIPSTNGSWTGLNMQQADFGGGASTAENTAANVSTKDSWQSIKSTITLGTDVTGKIEVDGDTGSAGQIFYFRNISATLRGCVAEYDGSGIASDKWLDKSGNDLHGTVSGASVENAPSNDDGLVYDSGTWTPAFDNLTEGNATISGFYKRIGDLVYVQGEIVWGSSTSASGATAINNLPFTISNDIEPFGNAYITDSGTASYFGKVQGTVNSTTLLLQEQNSGGSGNPVSAGSITEASPFTWTTNDVFKFEITYRTA